MFMLKSTHDRIVSSIRYEADSYLHEWKKTADLFHDACALNERLKRDFVESQRPKTVTVTQFSQDEIQKLLMLCHPDKHGGKEMAMKMTQKLLSLRG